MLFRSMFLREHKQFGTAIHAFEDDHAHNFVLAADESVHCSICGDGVSSAPPVFVDFGDVQESLARLRSEEAQHRLALSRRREERELRERREIAAEEAEEWRRRAELLANQRKRGRATTVLTGSRGFGSRVERVLLGG